MTIGGVWTRRLADLSRRAAGRKARAHPAVLALAAQVTLATTLAGPALAAMPLPDGQMAVVGYIDVSRKQTASAQSILQDLVTRARRDPANTQALLLQNAERPTEFVLVSIWRSKDGHARFVGQPAVHQAHEQLVPMQTAPFDERQADPLDGSVQALVPAASAVYVVTHVDIVPQKIGEGLDVLKRYQSASTQQHGCMEVEILRQASRQNHFTLLEVWDSPDAFEAHLQSDEARAFRQTLLTMSGSLYDQRQFHLVTVAAGQGAYR